MKVPALLKNKYVCYALMALATLNVIGYVTVRAWECLALFALAGYSCYCYCKNKSCSILAALFVANFVFGCGRVKEGFEDAFKGPVEHLEDSATSAAAAESQCAGETKDACEATKNAAGAACSFVAAKEAEKCYKDGIEVAGKSEAECKDGVGDWNTSAAPPSCA